MPRVPRQAAKTRQSHARGGAREVQDDNSLPSLLVSESNSFSLQLDDMHAGNGRTRRHQQNSDNLASDVSRSATQRSARDNGCVGIRLVSPEAGYWGPRGNWVDASSVEDVVCARGEGHHDSDTSPSTTDQQGLHRQAPEHRYSSSAVHPGHSLSPRSRRTFYGLGTDAEDASFAPLGARRATVPKSSAARDSAHGTCGASDDTSSAVFDLNSSGLEGTFVRHDCTTYTPPPRLQRTYSKRIPRSYWTRAKTAQPAGEGQTERAALEQSPAAEESGHVELSSSRSSCSSGHQSDQNRTPVEQEDAPSFSTHYTEGSEPAGCETPPALLLPSDVPLTEAFGIGRYLLRSRRRPIPPSRSHSPLPVILEDDSPSCLQFTQTDRMTAKRKLTCRAQNRSKKARHEAPLRRKGKRLPRKSELLSTGEVAVTDVQHTLRIHAPTINPQLLKTARQSKQLNSRTQLSASGRRRIMAQPSASSPMQERIDTPSCRSIVQRLPASRDGATTVRAITMIPRLRFSKASPASVTASGSSPEPPPNAQRVPENSSWTHTSSLHPSRIPVHAGLRYRLASPSLPCSTAPSSLSIPPTAHDDLEFWHAEGDEPHSPREANKGQDPLVSVIDSIVDSSTPQGRANPSLRQLITDYSRMSGTSMTSYLLRLIDTPVLHPPPHQRRRRRQKRDQSQIGAQVDGNVGLQSIPSTERHIIGCTVKSSTATPSPSAADAQPSNMNAMMDHVQASQVTTFSHVSNTFGQHHRLPSHCASIGPAARQPPPPSLHRRQSIRHAHHYLTHTLLPPVQAHVAPSHAIATHPTQDAGKFPHNSQKLTTKANQIRRQASITPFKSPLKAGTLHSSPDFVDRLTRKLASTFPTTYAVHFPPAAQPNPRPLGARLVHTRRLR